MLQAHRILDTGHPSLENAQIKFERLFDRPEFGDLANAVELVQEQPDLGTAHAHFKHALQEINILLQKPVQSLQRFFASLLGFDQFVKIGNDRRGSGGGIRYQSFGECGELLGRLQRIGQALAQHLGGRDSPFDQFILLRQVS